MLSYTHICLHVYKHGLCVFVHSGLNCDHIHCKLPCFNVGLPIPEAEGSHVNVDVMLHKNPKMHPFLPVFKFHAKTLKTRTPTYSYTLDWEPIYIRFCPKIGYGGVQLCT